MGGFLKESLRRLDELKKRIDKELRIFFDKRILEVRHIDSSAKEMMELLKDFTLRGGKRVRAAMIYYGYKCFNKNKESELLKAAMCIELVNSSLLIHDDIIDCDSLRRGGLTLHKAYEKIHSKRYNGRKDAGHFGESMAIIAGDALACLANQLLVYSDFRKENKLRAIAKLNQAVHKVIYGQALDIISELKDNFNVKDILNIHHLKTASYTIEGPLHIGALLAGAGEKDLKVLSAYGIPLGKAFQIQDDILGMFGDEKELGKPVGSDIKEGKRTLLVLKAIEKGNLMQKAFIKRNLGNKHIGLQELREFRKIVEETGSLEYSQNLAKKLIEEAKSAVRNTKFRKEGKDFLLGIADYMLERNN